MANGTDGAHGPSARQAACRGRALAPPRRSAAARARRASAAGARRLRRMRKVPWRHMRALAPASATVGRGVGRAPTSGGGQQLGQLVEGGEDPLRTHHRRSRGCRAAGARGSSCCCGECCGEASRAPRSRMARPTRAARARQRSGKGRAAAGFILSSSPPRRAKVQRKPRSPRC